MAVDGFKNVGTLNAGFIRRAAGNHCDHGCVAETLGNGCPNIRLRVALFRLVVVVLPGTEIAGIRVQRLKQSVQRAIGHLGDVRVLDVLAVHTRQHFAVNLELAVSAIVGRGAHATQSTDNHEQQHSERRNENCSFSLH